MVLLGRPLTGSSFSEPMPSPSSPIQTSQPTFRRPAMNTASLRKCRVIWRVVHSHTCLLASSRPKSLNSARYGTHNSVQCCYCTCFLPMTSTSRFAFLKQNNAHLFRHMGQYSYAVTDAVSWSIAARTSRSSSSNRVQAGCSGAAAIT